jgi:thiol:disulfide interchange protein
MKDEKKIWLIVGGIFTVVFALCAAFGLKPGMPHVWSIVLGVLFLICCLSWIITMVKFTDPNFDYWRVVNILSAFLACCVIMGHRAGYFENKAFEKDVQKAQQEQTK